MVKGSRLSRYLSKSFTHWLIKSHTSMAVVDHVAAHGGEPDEIGTWFGLEEDVGAIGHLMPAQVGDDQLLAVQFVRLLDTRREDGMTLCCIAANDQHQRSHADVCNRTRVTTMANGAKQALGCRRLAVARAVIDVIGTDDLARKLLHQVGFFIRAL